MTDSKAPTISVVVPVHNGARHLERCLNSLAAQSYRDFEVLIADDASTDDSAAIAERVALPRRRVVRRPRNVGLFANLNSAVDEASGSIVRFLCQDDELMPQALALEAEYFKRHSNVSMTYGKMIVVDDAGVELERAALDDVPEIMQPAECYQHFFYHECIAGNLSAVCVRRECFLEAGGFEESYRYAADFELWVRLCTHRPMGVVHRHQYRLRTHAGQLSRSADALVGFVRERRRIRRKVRARLPGELARVVDRYDRWRLNVVDANAAIYALRRGHFQRALRVAGILGLRDLASGVLCWLLSANNRFYMPPKRFLVDTALREVSSAA